MATELDVVEVQRTPSFALGHVDRLAVAVFHDVTTVEQLEALEGLVRQLQAKHGHAVVLTVITQLKRAPPPEVRKRAVELSDSRGATTPSVLVLKATGLGAVLFRGFMATLALLAPNASTSRVVKSSADGVQALGEHLTGVGPSPQALAEAIDRFAALR